MDQYQIRIEEPCNENWNTMTPQEQGRFCDVCSKEVVDFTEMNDEEIKGYFKHYTGSLCGRFRTSQLEEKDRRYFSLPEYTKKFIRAFAIAFLMFSAFESNGQTVSQEVMMGDVVCEEKSQIRFTGTVLGVDGVGLNNARMQFYKKGQFVKEINTSADGAYRIQLELGQYDIVISRNGFRAKRVSISISKNATLGDFVLEELKQDEHPILMGKIKMGKPIMKKLD